MDRCMARGLFCVGFLMMILSVVTAVENGSQAQSGPTSTCCMRGAIFPITGASCATIFINSLGQPVLLGCTTLTPCDGATNHPAGVGNATCPTWTGANCVRPVTVNRTVPQYVLTCNNIPAQLCPCTVVQNGTTTVSNAGDCSGFLCPGSP